MYRIIILDKIFIVLGRNQSKGIDLILWMDVNDF